MAPVSEARLLAIWDEVAERPPLARTLMLAAAGGADVRDVADLTVGRRDQYLLALRESCFGTVYACEVGCPECGVELELELDGTDIRREGPQSDTASVPHDGSTVDLRPVTSRDLMAVSGHTDARAELIRRCVISPAAPVLADDVLDAGSAALASLDPQADVTVDLDCADCGHRWCAPFDIASYLWCELTAQVARTLRDVHNLATVYGWSEADVLAVSPPRRRHYLEMATP